jgi:hypothetical protein
MTISIEVNEALIGSGHDRPMLRHPREGGDPFKFHLKLKLLTWTDPRLRGDDGK